MMIVVALLGLLAAVAIPNFIRSRTNAQTNACISNLRTIDYAIQQWALEVRKAANAPVEFSDISSYLRNSVICPAGGENFDDSYSITAVGTQPNCQRYPGAHVLNQLTASLIIPPTDPSSDPGLASPTSSNGSPGQGPSAGPKGKPGNGNGHGNGNGTGNGNGNPP
jgi:type II secretory pathway pseudopilin PulG